MNPTLRIYKHHFSNHVSIGSGSGNDPYKILDLDLRKHQLSNTLKDLMRKYIVKVNGFTSSLSFASFENLSKGQLVTCNTYLGKKQGKVIREATGRDFAPYFFCLSINTVEHEPKKKGTEMNKEIQKRIKNGIKYILINVTEATDYKDNISVDLRGSGCLYSSPEECAERIQVLLQKNPKNKYIMMESYSYIETELPPVKTTRIKDFV